MKKYSVIRNYKNIKRKYRNLIAFIKCKDYYAFDNDAKIMMYSYDYFEDSYFKYNKKSHKK